MANWRISWSEPADPLAKAQRQKPFRKAPTKREPPPPKWRKISKTDAAEALLELSSSFTSLSSDITTHEDLSNEVPVSENNSVHNDDSQSQVEQKCQPTNDICDRHKILLQKLWYRFIWG